MDSVERKLLSIVVPTKDRYKYLKNLIELVDGLHSSEVEVVIQDNSDDNSEILSFFSEHEYDFVRYDYHKGQLPMSVNSDKAVLNSTGEYICFLGDDDGVTRHIIEGVKWMKANKVEAVKLNVPSYYWPDASQGRGVSQSAEIIYKKYDGSVRSLKPEKELLKVLREGIPDRGDMPLAYHAIVSREAMDRVYAKCDTYFPANSPDIANAVALSLVVNKYALVNLPWVISGNCVYKGGGVGAPGKKYPPEISDMPWFRPNAEEKWHETIPRIAVGETIWPESAIQALIAMGRSDLLKKINYNKLYARFYMQRPSLRYLLHDVHGDTLGMKFEYFKMIINKYWSALWRRIGWMLNIGKPLHIYKVESIIEAQKQLEMVSDGKPTV